MTLSLTPETPATCDDDPGTPTPPCFLGGSAPFYDGVDMVIGDTNQDNKPDLLFITGDPYDPAGVGGGDGARRERLFLNTTLFNGANNPITFAEVTDAFLPNVAEDSYGGLILNLEGNPGGDNDIVTYGTDGIRVFENVSENP